MGEFIDIKVPDTIEPASALVTEVLVSRGGWVRSGDEVMTLEAGETKRLCYLTAAEASINETTGVAGMGYKMAKAGLHQFLQITRNVLAPKNYTMRVYDPMHDQICTQMAAQAAFNYFTRGRGVERGDALRDDEGNLVFRDAYGRQHSW